MSVNDSLTAQINTVIAELKDKFTPNITLMTAIKSHMHASVDANFQNEGANIPGGRWKRTMFPGKALQKTGGLVRSIQSTATDNTAIVHTNYPWASLMHFGGEIQAKKKLGSVKRKKDVWAMEQYFWAMWYASSKKERLFKILALHMQKSSFVTIPARPFMVLTEHYKDEIIKTIRNHVTK